MTRYPVSGLTEQFSLVRFTSLIGQCTRNRAGGSSGCVFGVVAGVRRRRRPIASSLPPPSTLLLLQHPSGPQPLIELDAIYNTVMEMAWKMNGPKRWDFLNFLREIILEREKEKPICSFSCMGLPPSFSGLLSFAHVSSPSQSLCFALYLSFSYVPTPVLSLPVIGFLFWGVKRHDLLYLQPQSLEPTRSPPPPPIVVLIAWEKGEGVKSAGGRSISTESVQSCASISTEEKFTAEQVSCSERVMSEILSHLQGLRYGILHLKSE